MHRSMLAATGMPILEPAVLRTQYVSKHKEGSDQLKKNEDPPPGPPGGPPLGSPSLDEHTRIYDCVLVV